MTGRAFSGLAMLLLAGCSSIPVNVGTTEPVKVDIAMKVDVYQHADPGAAKKVVVQPPPTDVAKARRSRMAEIQLLKNSRIVGENHAGYLEVRTRPRANMATMCGLRWTRRMPTGRG